MCKKSDREVDAESPKEEEEERHPSHSFHERVPHVTMSKSIFQEDISNISRTGKYSKDCKEYFETVQVVAIRVESEPEEKVVQNGKDTRCGNTIIRKHVCKHAELVMDRRIRPYEDAQLLVDGTFSPPIDEGVEYQLAASIGIFLPSVKLIVDR